jgi:hypothetical protein
VIELFFADQIVPTGELFRAMQAGTIDAVHSDDDSMASPVEVGSSAAISRSPPSSILDVPVLFQQYGLADIWREAYGQVGVCGSRPPGRIRATSTPRRKSPASPISTA